jgi:hypothetical protein
MEQTMEQPPSTPAAPRPITRRDTRTGKRIRVRAGQLLPGIDGRSWWTRRARELIASYISDLGGAANVSAAERGIIRRIAVLQIELERLEFRFAMLPDDVAADPNDIDLYQRTAGGFRRLLETVGIKRQPRDITPDPLDYARSLEKDDTP